MTTKTSSSGNAGSARLYKGLPFTKNSGTTKKVYAQRIHVDDGNDIFDFPQSGDGHPVVIKHIPNAVKRTFLP